MSKLAEVYKTAQWSYPMQGKDQFHNMARAQLRKIAKAMGLQPGQYDIRSSKGGPAVLGEAILHTDHVYVMVGGSFQPVMYRTCKGRRDYSGGVNQWTDFRVFEDTEEFAARLNRLTAQAKQQAEA